MRVADTFWVAYRRTDVLIIGAGVSGLTTTLSLLEAGLPASSLRLIAAEPPALTASRCAGAIWGPYLSSYDRETEEWSRYTRYRLAELANEPDAGVHLVSGMEASRIPTNPPGWAVEVDGFQPCGPNELPSGFVSGWRYTVPVVDMPLYLAYIEKRLGQAGVFVETSGLTSLDEATTAARIVVNCTGFGARRLVPDDTVRPVRGQLVVVENPGIEQFFAERTDGSDELTYLLPIGSHVVLGGSVEEDRDDCVADPEIAQGILDRCAQIEPALHGAKLIEHRVGVRPTRPRPRVERDETRATPVMHNYGHGGSGVSFSWGCAREIARLVMAS
jgi:D-amino-acid oxidase